MGTEAEELLAAGILGVGRLGGEWLALWGIGVAGMVGLSVGWKGGVARVGFNCWWAGWGMGLAGWVGGGNLP